MTIYIYHTNFALNINRILDIFKEHRRVHTGSADAKNFIHGPGASLLRTLRQLTDKEAAKVQEILSYFHAKVIVNRLDTDGERKRRQRGSKDTGEAR